MDRPAANEDVNWIKRGQHSVSVTTFSSGGANHNQGVSSDSIKQVHDGLVHLKIRSESERVLKPNARRINIPVVNVISKLSDDDSFQNLDNSRSTVNASLNESPGSRSGAGSRSRSRATSEPPSSNRSRSRSITRVIPICLQDSPDPRTDPRSDKGGIARFTSSNSINQVQGKQKIYTSGVYQECAPVRPSASSDSNSAPFNTSQSVGLSKPKSSVTGSCCINSGIGNYRSRVESEPDPKIRSQGFSISSHPPPPPTAITRSRVEVEITHTGNPVRVSKSRPYSGRACAEESTGTAHSGDMHGGGIHSTDQRSSTYVSSISVRDAAKPPPIPATVLGSVHGGNLNDVSGVPIYWHHGTGGRVLPSPVGVNASPTSAAEQQRNVIIGGQRYSAPNAPFTNTSGQSHQVSVQYQSVYQSSGPSGYSSPRSSIGSGGGDSQGNSIASSPRSSLANAAALYEKRRFGGSPRSSLALANPAVPNRSGWTVQMVEATSSRQMSGSPHDPRLTSSSLSISSQQQPAMISMGTRNNNAHLQLLSDKRFGEPAPPPPPPHIYTDPRQRTLPAQAQTAVSVNTSARASGSSNAGTLNTILETRSANSLQNGASVSPSMQHSAASPQSTSNTVPAPSPPPVLPARVPLNYRNVAQQHMLNRQGEADAEMTVAALTQQLERDMTLSFGGKKSLPEPSPSEPPPPYHGPHDVQTSVKHTVVTPNQTQNSGPTTQSGKPSVRLVAPVQGIQIQPPTSLGAARSQQSRGSNVSPGGLKSQLAFQVTPPKTSGPSDAERKLAALTQQLEDEMEQTSGDYFGEFLFSFDKTKTNSVSRKNIMIQGFKCSILRIQAHNYIIDNIKKNIALIPAFKRAFL